jgi:DNA polymerase III alpha subunit
LIYLILQMLKKLGISLDLKKIPLDDPGVYQMMSNADTLGVFQMVKSGFQRMLLKMRPDCFEDVVSCGALYRPGPLKGGMVDDFIKRKHGEQKVVYLHPALEDATKNTYGILVYQEQPMMVSRVLAGYTLGGADLLRRAMGKKKKEVMEKEEAKFLAGCAKVGKCDQATAKKIFDLMSFFSGYGFNRAHSAAYGLISYYTAYLKHHHPLEFYAAHLSVQADEQDKSKKIAEAAFELRRKNVKILPPDANRSERDFVPEGSAVRFGFSGIKGFGDSAAGALLAERGRGGKFTSLADLARRVPGMGARAITALIMSGGCDSILPVTDGKLAAREAAVALVPALIQYLADRAKRAPAPTQRSLFDLLAPADRPPEPTPPPFPQVPVDLVGRLAGERATLGFYLSSHPILSLRKKLKEMGVSTLRQVLAGSEDERVKVAALVAGKPFEKRTQKDEWMGILTLEDPWRRAEAVCFPRTYSVAAGVMEDHPGEPLIFGISASGKGTSRKLIVDKVTPLSGDDQPLEDKGARVKDFVSMDLETCSIGGAAPGRMVDPGHFRIVEVGAAVFADRMFKRIVSRLLNPQIPIDKGSEAIHGIGDAMVKEAKTFEQAMDDLATFLKGKIILVYNGRRFDIPVLNESFARAGHAFRIVPGQVVDLYQWIRPKYPGMTRRPKSKQLRDQAEFFGVKLTTAHRAADDAMATGALFLAMQDRGVLPRGLTTLQSAE